MSNFRRVLTPLGNIKLQLFRVQRSCLYILPKFHKLLILLLKQIWKNKIIIRHQGAKPEKVLPQSRGKDLSCNNLQVFIFSSVENRIIFPSSLKFFNLMKLWLKYFPLFSEMRSWNVLMFYGSDYPKLEKKSKL